VQRGALQRHATTSEEIDAYTFERHVTFNHANGSPSTGLIDL
jgi:hypothetical protein